MFSWYARCALVGLVIGITHDSATADDNVLGLPAPIDARQPGAVVLHGGGDITDEVFERFVELAGGREARIVLVPSAGYRVSDYDSEKEFLDEMGSRYCSWVDLAVAGRVRGFQFLYTDNPDDADNADFVRPLELATGVWFSGGAQKRLNYRYVGEFPRQTRFQAALVRIVERGGAVGGTSAGMAALPEIMTLRDARENSHAPAKVVAAHGLGLLKQAIVEQHLDARGGRLERFTRLLRDSSQLDELAGRKGAGNHMLGLAVEEGGALFVRGDHLEVRGTANVHVFLKSEESRKVAWHELEPGDVAELKRDSSHAIELTQEDRLSSR